MLGTVLLAPATHATSNAPADPAALASVPAAQPGRAAKPPAAAASASTKAARAAATAASGASAGGKHGKHKKKPPAQSKRPAGPLYSSRADAMLAADSIAAELSLPRSWVRHAIGQARFVPAVANAVLPPAPGVAKNWAAYRDRFIEPRRIAAGVRFWQANQASLQRAQEVYGVPPAIVVGILGVESFYGRQTGNFRIIDALCTLAFDFPAAHPNAAARSAYFRSELNAYLALAARTHTDPLALHGSYAGAMGWPQFMPSSWSRYAVDFEGDGHIDLFNSQADIIGSVANYLHAFHWEAGVAPRFAVQVHASDADLAALLQADIVPTLQAADLAAKGVTLDEAARQYTGPLALIALQNGDAAPEYLAGTGNFYAITRYNWSAYYAMAVIALGEAVSNAMPK